MNIFEYATRMEKDGEDFYRRLVEQTENKGLETILTMLADDEVKHYTVLEEMQSSEPEMAETQILENSKNIFERMRETGQTIDTDVVQLDLYSQAQDIEQMSIDFYELKVEEVELDYQRDLFERLAEEERKHFFLLDNVIDFLFQPQSWLENAEFVHLNDY